MASFCYMYILVTANRHFGFNSLYLQVIMVSSPYNGFVETALTLTLPLCNLNLFIILITFALVVDLLNKQTNKLDDLLTTYLKGDDGNELRTDRLRECLQTSADVTGLVLP